MYDDVCVIIKGCTTAAFGMIFLALNRHLSLCAHSATMDVCIVIVVGLSCVLLSVAGCMLPTVLVACLTRVLTVTTGGLGIAIIELLDHSTSMLGAIALGWLLTDTTTHYGYKEVTICFYFFIASMLASVALLVHLLLHADMI